MVATGAAPLVYQWQRNGVALTDAAGIVGAATSALTLTLPYSFNTSWGGLQTLNSAVGTNATDSQVAVAPDGAAAVVFAQSNGVGPRVWGVSSSAAGVWSGPGLVGLRPAFTPQVTMAANGQADRLYLGGVGQPQSGHQLQCAGAVIGNQQQYRLDARDG